MHGQPAEASGIRGLGGGRPGWLSQPGHAASLEISIVSSAIAGEALRRANWVAAIRRAAMLSVRVKPCFAAAKFSPSCPIGRDGDTDLEAMR